MIPIVQYLKISNAFPPTWVGWALCAWIMAVPVIVWLVLRRRQ